MTKAQYFNLACKEIKKHTKSSIKKAIKYYKISLDTSNKYRAANTYYDIGVAYHFLIDLSKNMKYANDALAFYKKSLRYLLYFLKTDVYNNIGCIYDELLRENPSSKKYKNYAFKNYKLSIKFMGRFKYPGPYVNIAGLYAWLGYKNNESFDYKRSVEYYEKLYSNDLSNSAEYDLDEVTILYKLLSKNYSRNKDWVLNNVHNTINPFSENNINILHKKDGLTIVHLIADILLYLQGHLSKLYGGNRNELLYQYTKIHTLSSICNIDKNISGKNRPFKFHLRLYNSDYMNDPSEGKALFNALIISDKDNSQGCKRIRHLLDIIYPSDKKYLHASHVYIASLSSVNPFSNDSMPLWNLYADDHKGVAMGLSFNGVEQGSHGFHSIDNRMNFNGINYFRERDRSEAFAHKNRIPLKLYRVSYDINDVNNIDDLRKAFKEAKGDKKLELSLRLQDAGELQMIAHLMGSLSDNIINNDKHIHFIIKYNLDRIRFLLKSGVYKYEKEYRIMEGNYDYTKTHYDKGNEKLFIELTPAASINVNLKEIIFGNRCKSNYWLPFVERQLGSNVKLLKSNIKYR